MSKEKLIEELISNPEGFDETKLNELLNIKGFSAKDLKKILLRLFDKNDDVILNDSEADKSCLGKWNKKSYKKRKKLFWRKIKKGNISKTILAEGDSWFEYPIYINDIVDHLNKNNSYAIRSLASGGDWMSNILYENEYIEELSMIRPDVFLISGGGNDIVGGSRLALLLNKRNEINIPDNINLGTHKGKLEFAELALNREFFSLIKIFRLQYKLLFKDLKINSPDSKFKNLKIITQGYDYIIPSSKKGFGFNLFKMLRPVINIFVKNGKWLNTPIILRGYRESLEKEAITYGTVEYFNLMLIELTEEYENVYHIDSRNSVNRKKGWNDEIHPTSKGFKKIADTFKLCIESNDKTKKVYKVVD